MILFPVAERSGTLISDPRTVPDSGVYRVSLIGIPTAEYEDPARGIDMRFQFYNQSRQAWRTRASITWQGQVGGWTDRHGTHNPPPFLQIELDHIVANEVRIGAIVTGTLTFGVEVLRVT